MKKEQAGNDKEIAQSEKIPTPKTEGWDNDTKVLIRRKDIVSRVSSYSPIDGHSVTRIELKYENVHKAQTAQKFDSKTQNN